MREVWSRLAATRRGALHPKKSWPVSRPSHMIDRRSPLRRLAVVGVARSEDRTQRKTMSAPPTKATLTILRAWNGKKVQRREAAKRFVTVDACDSAAIDAKIRCERGFGTVAALTSCGVASDPGPTRRSPCLIRSSRWRTSSACPTHVSYPPRYGSVRWIFSPKGSNEPARLLFLEPLSRRIE